LQHFTFGDHRGGGRKHVERFQRADLDHHLEGLAEQEIADQHAGLVAPDHPGGRAAASEIALVDDVIMQERCRVHELDRRGELDVGFALVAKHRRRGQCQHRPEPLAARRNQVVCHFRDHGDVGTCLGQNQLVDALHVGLGVFDQRLDRGVSLFSFVQ